MEGYKLSDTDRETIRPYLRKVEPGETPLYWFVSSIEIWSKNPPGEFGTVPEERIDCITQFGSLVPGVYGADHVDAEELKSP